MYNPQGIAKNRNMIAERLWVRISRAREREKRASDGLRNPESRIQNPEWELGRELDSS
jgi:hypothetical protein